MKEPPSPRTTLTVVLCLNVLVASFTPGALARGPESTHLVPVAPGWNLLSLPASVSNGSKAFLFPSAASPAYVFQNPEGYVQRDTLSNGRGFWLKFASADTAIIGGDDVFADTIEGRAGWNIIGTISVAIDTASVVTNPPGIIASEFFEYVPAVGYRQADTLHPGVGYWVKLRQNGSIVLTALGVPCVGTPTVTYAGKVYHTVQIGNQCWLRENLDVGTRIPGSQNQANNGTMEKYCYNDSAANCDAYGGLYQWDEALQYDTAQGTQGICPAGWHMPTSAEFQALSATVAGDGNALKAVGQGSGGGAGTNTSGFSALLGGVRFGFGFFYIGLYGDMWSSTQTSATYADDMNMSNVGGGITIGDNPKNLGFSVRCLKD
jgi:uncharacterized protein (TIGR02145 family)